VVPGNLFIISASTRASRGATRVQFSRDGVNNSLDLSQFLLQILRAGSGAVLVNPLGGLFDGSEDGLLVLIANLTTHAFLIGDLVSEAIDERREAVERFDTLALGFVLGSEFFGLGDHAVDFLLRETALFVGNGDGLGFTSSLISGRDFHDTIGVDLESDFDLRNTTRSGRDGRQFEFAEEVVVLGQRTFTFEDLDQDGGLVVGSGREDLALPGGNDGVTGDELGEDSTGGFDTESEGANVDEDDIGSSFSSRENTTLDSGTVGNSLVRVDTL